MTIHDVVAGDIVPTERVDSESSLPASARSELTRARTRCAQEPQPPKPVLTASVHSPNAHRAVRDATPRSPSTLRDGRFARRAAMSRRAISDGRREISRTVGLPDRKSSLRLPRPPR